MGSNPKAQSHLIKPLEGSLAPCRIRPIHLQTSSTTSIPYYWAAEASERIPVAQTPTFYTKSSASASMVTIPTLTVKLLKQTYLTANDMRNFHQMIINHISKVIGWEPIIFDDYLVIHNLVFKLHFPMHQIPKLSLAFRHAHSDYKWLTVGFLLLDLICAKILQAKPIIHSFCVFLTTDLDSHLCKALRSTKTWVGIAILHLNKCERPSYLLASTIKRTYHRFRVVTIGSMGCRDLMSHPCHRETQDPLSIRGLPTSSS